MTKRIAGVSMVVVATLLLALSGFGQGGGEASLGRITGRVTDPSGAVIPGVAVEIVNVLTGVRNKDQTNSAGEYSFLLLPIGTYTVSASAQGFKSFAQTSIVLVAGTRATVDIALQVGASTETVTVTGRASTVDTSSTSTGLTRVNQEIASLPIESTASRGRMIQSVLATYPGNVYRVAAYSENMLFAYASTMNGSDSSNNTFEIDGASGAESLQTQASGNTGLNPELIDEVRIETNPNAEYGHNLGNDFSVITKSGTNTWHGSGYQYYESGNWSAASFGNNANPSLAHNQKRGGFQQNEPGGTVGGPILKDRLFVFGSYDWHHNLSTSNPTIGTLPTTKMHNGDFSELLQRTTGGCATPPCQIGTDSLGRPIYFGEIYNPATNRSDGHGGTIRDGFGFDPVTGLPTATANMIPAGQLSGPSKVFAGAVPSANFGPAGALTSNWEGAPLGGGDNLRRPSVRVDYNLGKQRLGFFLELVDPYNVLNACVSSWANNQGLPVIGCIISPRHDRHWRFSDTVTLSPTMVLEGSFTHNVQESFVGVCCQGTTFGKTMGLQGFASDFTPFVMTQNYGLMGYDVSSDEAAGGTWNWAASLSWVKGKHNFKFGGTLEHGYSNSVSDTLGSGEFNFSQAETGLPGYTGTGWDFASIMLGLSDTITAAIPGSEQYSHADQVAFFGQDSWRVTKKLTANYGLRWDIGLPGADCRVPFSTFDPNTPNPAAGGIKGALDFYGPGLMTGHCATLNTYWKALGPRLGLAYALNSKTALRAYYGIIYSQDNSGGPTYQKTYSRQGAFTSPDGGLTAAFNWSNPFTNVSPTGSTIIPASAAVSTNPSQNNGGGVTWDQWNENKPGMAQAIGLGVERQLGWGFVIRADYVGKMIHGLDQENIGGGSGTVTWQYDAIPLKYFPLGALLNQNINSTDPNVQAQIAAAGISKPWPTFTGTVGQAVRPWPQYTSVTAYSPSGWSTYNALQMNLQKRFGSGLSFLANFTDSKYLELDPGLGQVPQLRRQAKTVGYPDNGTDRPKVLNISYVYQLPLGRGKRFASTSNPVLSRLVGGWTVSSIQQYFSGQALHPTSNSGYYPIRNNSVPVLNPEGCKGYNYSVPFNPNDPSQRLVNPGSFSSPVGPYVLGNTNVYAQGRDCGVASEQISVMKETLIKERFTTKLGVDLFNAFNRHSWGTPNMNVDSPAFGEAGGGGFPARQVQVYYRVEF